MSWNVIVIYLFYLRLGVLQALIDKRIENETIENNCKNNANNVSENIK